MQKRHIYSLSSLVLLALLFAGFSVLTGQLLRGVKLDLTENRLYTLSPGTRNILADLPEPVNLTLFFSEDASRDLPQIRSYARRVTEMLDEFEDRSGGKVTIKRVDPAPFSEEEDQAARYGLQAVPVGASGTSLFFGIAGTNTLDDVQTMPFLQPSKENFLEYDLAKMVYSLGRPQRKVVGLASSLQMAPGFDPATQGMREAWVIYEQLSQLFEIRQVDLQSGELPDDLDVLVVVHPRQLSDAALYQLDQFVLGGGRLVAFIDPVAETDQGDPGDPMAQMQRGSSSTLGQLLEAWGLDYDPARAVGDLQFGIGSGQSRHIGILSVPAAGMNADDIISADLEVLNLSSTGWLLPRDGAATTIEVLIETSENAAPMDASRLRFLANPNDLLSDFDPTGDRYPLAVRISGAAESAFESPPEGVDAGETLAKAGEGGINVVLFADTDLLSDRMWVQKQPFLGQTLVSSFADNGNLVVNAVDNMLGNSDLISIRTRASSGRPFERVDALQLVAEEKYRATEERLQAELTETERKLTELQAARGGDDLTVLTEEQQTEIQRFMDRRLEIRRDLRQVQHDLQRDIERLGTRLKVINIAFVPLLVIGFAIAYGVYRRRRQDRTAHPETD